MDRIIALLREKNLYLEKFYFINEQELINIGGGNFDTIESFYQARDKILDLVNCVDGLLNEENSRKPEGNSADLTAEQRSEIEALLRSKDEIVKAILVQDLQILTYIEKEKSNIIRELSANNKARRAVGAYASTERIQQLDE